MQNLKGFLELNVVPLPVWMAALVLACLDHCIRVDTFPVCSYSQAGCALPPLADVFDRVIQQSSKMHATSSDLHSEYVSWRSSLSQLPFCHASVSIRARVSAGAAFSSQQEHHWETQVPFLRHSNTQRQGERAEVRGEGSRLCSELPACVQNLGIVLFLLCFVKKEQLTEVILRLLGAWTDPLSRLYWSMSQGENKDLNLSGSNKALEMSEMVRELREGVAKVAEKVNLNLLDKEKVSCVPFLV